MFKKVLKKLILDSLAKQALALLSVNQNRIVDYLDDAVLGWLSVADLPAGIKDYFNDDDEELIRKKLRQLTRAVIIAVVNALVANSANVVEILKDKLK